MPELPKCHCNRCGHRWNPAVENPTVCPRCKSYDWQGQPEWVDDVSVRPNREEK